MPRRPIDIILFVEHVARELDIACAVKHLVTKRHGLSLEIASLAWDIGGTLAKYQPAVVATPYCYTIGDFGTHQIVPVWPDAYYVNLAYEQVFQKINKAPKMPRDRFSRQCVLHHAWGEFFVGFLEQSGVRKENIVLNGNPTYALYRPPYRGYFESREELAARFHLDPRKRWVFIPENYGVAFLNDRQMETRYGKFRDAQADRFRDFAAASFSQAARWWRKACEMPGVELVLRPRPATPKDKIVEALCQDGSTIPPRLHVIKEGTVREWILAADLVASSYSTTLIESAVASKPILMFIPIPFPDYVLADWYDLVPQARTETAFLDWVSDPDPGQTFRPLQAWAERTMLSRGDAIANIADLLASVRRKERHVPGPPGIGILKTRLREPLPRKLRGICNRIYHAIVRRPGKSWERDEITEADVARRLARWAQVLG